MSTAIKELSYPYITSRQDIAGGSPIIEGTRTAIRAIAGYYQMGMTVDEILATLSHLSASQVHSALAYYFDHQQEIDSELAEYAEEDYWKKTSKAAPKAERGVTWQRFPLSGGRCTFVITKDVYDGKRVPYRFSL